MTTADYLHLTKHITEKIIIAIVKEEYKGVHQNDDYKHVRITRNCAAQWVGVVEHYAGVEIQKVMGAGAL